MREWQMTDDQFRAQSYKNMQIQKRKKKEFKFTLLAGYRCCDGAISVLIEAYRQYHNLRYVPYSLKTAKFAGHNVPPLQYLEQRTPSLPVGYPSFSTHHR